MSLRELVEDLGLTEMQARRHLADRRIVQRKVSEERRQAVRRAVEAWDR